MTAQVQAKDPKRKIEKYLTEQTGSDEVEANFEAAKKCLGELNQKTRTFGREKANLLKDFLSIESVLNECTIESFNLINEFEDNWRFKGGRVWNVIVKAREKLANNCVGTLQE